MATMATTATLRNRPRPSIRACDRCRRRKARCDSKDAEETQGTLPLRQPCTNCQQSGELCTFDLPLAKRGPKTKRSKTASISSVSVGGPAAASPPALRFRESATASQPVLPAPAPTSALSPSLVTDSTTTWDSAHTGLHGVHADVALSPQTVHSTVSESASTRAVSSLQRWHNLFRTLRSRDPSANLQATVNRCFSLFFDYLFPLIPLVHEPSLRDGLNFFVSQASASTSARHASHTISEIWASFVQGNPTADSILDRANSLKYPELWPDSTFALITAVCAEAIFLLPKDIHKFPDGEAIAEIFLQASRNCLNSYLEADLEYPNANSVAIRYFHSNCLHAAGKPRFSWHIFGEATRLAQVMQMHEEKSLETLYPVEAELRRRAFWISYIGDKSAAILNNRPITIHKFSFESGITTAYPTGIEDEFDVSQGDPASTEAARRLLIAGFNANLRLWQSASDLLLEMRLLRDQKDVTLIGQQSLTPEERNRLDKLYVTFITSLDDLPPYLQADTLAAAGKDGTLKQYLIQCTNLQVSFHCLRMVITQRFEDMEYFTPGLEHTEMLLLRKTEIARDMLRIIREAPFWTLQVNGEPCVEKIRLIGASLLAIIDRNETSPISSRARNDFTILLDILTRLDSKASDALRNQRTWIV